MDVSQTGPLEDSAAFDRLVPDMLELILIWWWGERVGVAIFRNHVNVQVPLIELLQLRMYIQQRPRRGPIRDSATSDRLVPGMLELILIWWWG
jgi:hypothetical protein